MTGIPGSPLLQNFRDNLKLAASSREQISLVRVLMAEKDLHRP